MTNLPPPFPRKLGLVTLLAGVFRRRLPPAKAGMTEFAGALAASHWKRGETPGATQ